MTTSLSEKEFHDAVVCNYTDVIGEKLGGKILAFSDEWFAAAENLIKPKIPIRDATRFTHAGAWYDGWETRRHNEEEADWVIFKMGVASAKLVGCLVDTAFFNGNHAPFISVEAAHLSSDDDLKSLKESLWEPIFEKQECGPSQKHYFARKSKTDKSYTHVRLRMYPDGGIARFRLYGEVIPLLAADKRGTLDMASVKNGGVAVKYSDQHFGSADNLLLPGRGYDMSDGWETKRSRKAGHVDWVVVRLGSLTTIQEIVVDTAHFRGNFPQKVTIKAVNIDDESQLPDVTSDKWKTLIDETKTGPDKEHKYNIKDTGKYSHVIMIIIPDGGVKRLRVFGTFD